MSQIIIISIQHFIYPRYFTSTCFFFKLLPKAFLCLRPILVIAGSQQRHYFSQVCLPVKDFKMINSVLNSDFIKSFLTTIMKTIWLNTKSIIFCLWDIQNFGTELLQKEWQPSVLLLLLIPIIKLFFFKCSNLAFCANNGIFGINGQVEYMVGKKESLQLCLKHAHRYLECH